MWEKWLLMRLHRSGEGVVSHCFSLRASGKASWRRQPYGLSHSMGGRDLVLQSWGRDFQVDSLEQI